MESMVSRGSSTKEFKDELNLAKDLIQDAKDYLQREPRTAGER